MASEAVEDSFHDGQYCPKTTQDGSKPAPDGPKMLPKITICIDRGSGGGISPAAVVVLIRSRGGCSCNSGRSRQSFRPGHSGVALGPAGSAGKPEPITNVCALDYVGLLAFTVLKSAQKGPNRPLRRHETGLPWEGPASRLALLSPIQAQVCFGAATGPLGPS